MYRLYRLELEAGVCKWFVNKHIVYHKSNHRIITCAES